MTMVELFHRCVGALCLVAVLVCSVGASAEGPPTIRLETVWELALTKSPALSRARLTGRALVAEGDAVRALPAPSIEGKGEWPQGSHSEETKTEYEVSVAQPFRLGDVTGARRNVASLSRELGSLDEQLEVQRFFFTVEESFAELAALERFHRSFDRSIVRARGVFSRLNGGRLTLALQASERALLEAESAGFQGVDRGLRAEIAERRAALERLIGAEIPPGTLEVPLLGEPIPATDFVRAVRGAPEGLSRRLALQVERATRRAELLRLEREGELTPRVIYRRSDDGTDFLGFGVEMPLPVWGASRGAIRSEEGEREAALVERSYVESPMFERYLTAMSEAYRQRREQVDLLNGKVVPALERAVSASAQELEAGQSSVAQFIALVRELHERSRDAVETYVLAVRLGAEVRMLRGERL